MDEIMTNILILDEGCQMFFQRCFVYSTFFFICLLILGNRPVFAAADKNIVPRISAAQVKQMIGLPETVIIDVRRFRNWWRSSKKILAAVREDPSKVDKWAQKYAKDKTLIFYCS
jgi:predicted sulfurtransferase